MSTHVTRIEPSAWVVQFRNWFRDPDFYCPDNPLEMFVLLISFEVAYALDSYTGGSRESWYRGMQFVFEEDDE